LVAGRPVSIAYLGNIPSVRKKPPRVYRKLGCILHQFYTLRCTWFGFLLCYSLGTLEVWAVAKVDTISSHERGAIGCNNA
jgi:hypothetical protein